MNSKKRRKKTTQVPERGKAQLCDPWYDAGVLQGVSPSALLTTFGFQSIWAVTAFVLTPPLTEMLISPSTIPMPFVLLVMLFVIFPVNASFGYFRWGIFAISILFCIDNVQWAAGRWNGFMLTYASAAMPFYLLPQGEYIFVHVGIWLYLALIEPSVYYSRRRILVSIGALLLIYILLSTFIAAILKYFYFRFSIPASWTSLAICPTAIFGGVLIACKQNQHILRAPLLKKAPAIEVCKLDDCTDAEGSFSIAHLSDIHLTGGENTAEKQQSPDHKFAAICRHDKLIEADIVVATGDITDTGHPVEWRAFFQSLLPDTLAKLVLVPGNHDVAIIDRSRTRVEDVDAFSRTQRLIRVISAIDKVQGGRATIIDNNRKACRLSTFLAPYVEGINEFMQSPPALRRAAPDSEVELAPQNIDECLASSRTDFVVHGIWHTIFPMVVESSVSKVFFVVLDSNNLSFSMFNNAFGAAGSKIDGFERLSQLQEHFRNVHLLYAVHHHLIQPPQVKLLSGWPRFQARFMVMADSPYLYQAIAGKRSKRTIVFHGHHHIHYIVRLDGLVDIVGAPSSGFGDCVPNSVGPGFYVYKAERGSSGISLKSGQYVAV